MTRQTAASYPDARTYSVDPRLRVSDWAAFAVCAVLTCLIGLGLDREPDRVQLTIENPTATRIYVAASSPESDSTTFVAIVGPHARVTVSDVIDRGPNWIFHLRTEGAPAGTVSATSDELERSGLTLPETTGVDPLEVAISDDAPDGQ